MNKKKADGLDALRDAIIIRKRVTELLKVLYLQTKKRLEQLGLNASENADKIREDFFNLWLIQEESRIIANCASDISGNIRTANSIWPVYMAEFAERRVYMDRAMACCNKLQDELQYIAEAIYADKNKFTALVLEIQKLFSKVKSIRQADNRFLKDIKGR